jgi:hypothetical protein
VRRTLYDRFRCIRSLDSRRVLLVVSLMFAAFWARLRDVLLEPVPAIEMPEDIRYSRHGVVHDESLTPPGAACVLYDGYRDLDTVAHPHVESGGFRRAYRGAVCPEQARS